MKKRNPRPKYERLEDLPPGERLTEMWRLQEEQAKRERRMEFFFSLWDSRHFALILLLVCPVTAWILGKHLESILPGAVYEHNYPSGFALTCFAGFFMMMILSEIPEFSSTRIRTLVSSIVYSLLVTSRYIDSVNLMVLTGVSAGLLVSFMVFLYKYLREDSRWQ